MKRYFWFIIIILILYFSINLIQFGLRLARGHRIANESTPFEVKNPNAMRRMLTVGDSTGVGTGVNIPSQSIAGLIAQEYHCVEIINRAQNGAMVAQVIAQLDSVHGQGFDLVLVQVGGNDILRFTPLHDLQVSTYNLLKKARSKGRHVIFMSSGNVGNAPALFPPFTWLYTHRTLLVRKVFHDISGELGIQYVDLFKPRREDPFLADKARYFAPDLLHPSAQGYRLWYGEMKRQTSLDQILRCID
jgi:lysophospholipase L1-like esterase